MAAPAEQKHPQYARDFELVQRLLAQAAARPIPELDLVEVARLRIRYHGFPGAYDVQQTLGVILQQWGLSEEDLFAQTRQIHQVRQVYQSSFSKRDDWA